MQDFNTLIDDIVNGSNQFNIKEYLKNRAITILTELSDPDGILLRGNFVYFKGKKIASLSNDGKINYKSMSGEEKQFDTVEELNDFLTSVSGGK